MVSVEGGHGGVCADPEVCRIRLRTQRICAAQSGRRVQVAYIRLRSEHGLLALFAKLLLNSVSRSKGFRQQCSPVVCILVAQGKCDSTSGSSSANSVIRLLFCCCMYQTSPLPPA